MIVDTTATTTATAMTTTTGMTTGAATCCGSVGGDALTDEQANELATALKALADPVRLRLVSLIATSPSGEVCACDLPESLDRSQPTVSHHLSLLVNAGVLEREQRGKWAWFRLRHERLNELSAVLAPPTADAADRSCR
jgi:ArsR family transcriptional regulator, arsenate/arsenite/antimonite-responsive transcriptional repressor